MMPTQAQIVVIQDRCDAIHEELKVLQRNDSRARVYLGRYYETILNRFITPLNMRLVENNLSTTDFIDSQNEFNKTRTNFMIDYVEYQKGLEELVAMNCKELPEQFYEKLISVRVKRATVADDTIKLRSLADKYSELVKGLKVKL